MKFRKIKHKTHKNFGTHSRIVEGGSKQIHPQEYREGKTESRTKAEKLNAADRLDYYDAQNG